MKLPALLAYAHWHDRNTSLVCRSVPLTNVVSFWVIDVAAFINHESFKKADSYICEVCPQRFEVDIIITNRLCRES